MKRIANSAACLLAMVLMLFVYSPARPIGARRGTGWATAPAPGLVRVEPATRGTYGASQPGKAEDRGWPRTYATPSGAYVTIYQPQVASWNNQQHIVAYAAVAYLATGTRTPAMGTLKVEADTNVSSESRLVSFSPLKITETNFQSLAKEQI